MPPRPSLSMEAVFEIAADIVVLRCGGVLADGTRDGIRIRSDTSALPAARLNDKSEAVYAVGIEELKADEEGGPLPQLRHARSRVPAPA